MSTSSRIIRTSSGGDKSLYLAKCNGTVNVFSSLWGGPASFAQPSMGNFTSALAVSANKIAVTTSNPDYPTGFLVRRLWDIHGKLIILGFNGQSNDVGASANLAGIESTQPPWMQNAPLKGKMMCVRGGITPIQDGVGAPTVTTIIDPSQYLGPLVDAHENINTGRTPGNNVNRQMWSSSAAMVIGAAVWNDNIVVPVNVGHGGTPFADDVQHAETLTGISWFAGVVTFVFLNNTNVGVGDQFIIKNVVPNGYNGTYQALSSNGFVVTAQLTSNPGSWQIGSGFGLVASAPMVNLRTLVRYLVSIAPGLGLDPFFAAMFYNGNEADSTLVADANFATQFATLRTLVNELGTIARSGVPWIVWPQVGWPNGDWHTTNPALWNVASPVTTGILAIANDPDNKCITFPQYSSMAGDGGDNQPGGCIHYNSFIDGHDNNGQYGAGLLLNAFITGANILPLQLLTGEDELQRTADGTVITGHFNRAATINESALITNPGNFGYQAFAGALTGGGNGFEVAISSIVIDGVNFTATLTEVPDTTIGCWIGYGYMNAEIFQQPNNTPISGATWASTAGGQATYTTTVPHGFVPNDDVVIALMNPPGFNVIPAVQALPGTGGTTIVLPLAVNPGPFISGGSVANNGEYGVGRNQGLRGNICDPNVELYNNCTGAAMPYLEAIQFAPQDVVSSTRSVVGILSQFNLTQYFSGVYDWADATCYPGTGQLVTNRGTGSIPVTNGIWTAGGGGQLFFTTASAHGYVPNDLVVIQDVSPTAMNGTYTALTGTTGSTIVVTKVSNTGTFTAPGLVLLNNYYLGLNDGTDGRDPSFTGTPGDFSRNTYAFANGAGKIWTPSVTNFLKNAHKAGGEGTIVIGGWVPGLGGLTSNNPQIATCLGEGSGQGPGLEIRIASNFGWTFLVEGDGGSSVFSRNGTALTPGDFFLIGTGFRAGDNTSWQYSGNRPVNNKYDFFNPVYNNPSTQNYQSPPYIWQNGATGTVRSNNLLRMSFMIVSDTKLDQPIMNGAMRSFARRQFRNLPA